jgi:hypothetical protein
VQSLYPDGCCAAVTPIGRGFLQQVRAHAHVVTYLWVIHRWALQFAWRCGLASGVITLACDRNRVRKLVPGSHRLPGEELEPVCGVPTVTGFAAPFGWDGPSLPRASCKRNTKVGFPIFRAGKRLGGSKCLTAIFLSHLSHLPIGRSGGPIEIAGFYSFGIRILPSTISATH